MHALATQQGSAAPQRSTGSSPEAVPADIRPHRESVNWTRCRSILDAAAVSAGELQQAGFGELSIYVLREALQACLTVMSSDGTSDCDGKHIMCRVNGSNATSVRWPVEIVNSPDQWPSLLDDLLTADTE